MGTAIFAFVTILSAIITAAASQSASRDQFSMLDDQQDFNSREAQIAREFSSEPERFRRMTSQLGFNPDLAAASIMGAPQNAAFAATSPNAPQVPNLAQSLGSLLGNSAGTSLEALMQPIEAENIQSQTNKNNMEIDWMPLTYEAQINMWDSYSSEAKSKAFLNNGPLYELYKGQAEYVVPLSQAQVQAYRTQSAENIGNAVLAFQKSLTEEDLRELYSAETRQALSQAILNGRLDYYYDRLAVKVDNETQVLQAQQTLLETDNTLRLFQALDEFYNVNLRQKMGGLPWSDNLSENLFIMQALGGDVATEAKTLEDELFAGMRRLYDQQVQMNWEHWFKNFANGLDAGDVVPNIFLPIGGGMQTKNPSPKKGAKKPSAGKDAFKSDVKQVNGQWYKSWQGSDGSIRWSPLESFGN